MTDIDQIARRIAKELSRQWDVEVPERIVTIIVAALREYGEAEYSRGSTAGYERAKDDFNIHD